VTIPPISQDYYPSRDSYRSFAGNLGKFGEGLVVLASSYQFSQVANKKVNNLFKWGIEMDDILLSFSAAV